MKGGDEHKIQINQFDIFYAQPLPASCCLPHLVTCLYPGHLARPLQSSVSTGLQYFLLTRQSLLYKASMNQGMVHGLYENKNKQKKVCPSLWTSFVDQGVLYWSAAFKA